VVDYAPAVKKTLREAGCELVRHGRGDHEIWWNPQTGQHFTVYSKIRNHEASRPSQTLQMTPIDLGEILLGLRVRYVRQLRPGGPLRGPPSTSDRAGPLLSIELVRTFLFRLRVAPPVVRLGSSEGSRCPSVP
jgi:hypothetical protein